MEGIRVPKIGVAGQTGGTQNCLSASNLGVQASRPVDSQNRETQITQTGASRRTQIDTERCIDHPPFIAPGPF